MPVIEYVPETIAAPEDLVAAIRNRRGGRLLNLDRMLLHSPAFAQGWNSFLGTVRNQLSVSPRLRELAICLVAVINQAEYELIQHAPEFIKAGGTDAQLAGLRNFPRRENYAALFDETERAVIDLTSEMTSYVAVSPPVMEKIKNCLPDEQQLTEIIGVIATYNMVSRYLVALGIEPE